MVVVRWTKKKHPRTAKKKTFKLHRESRKDNIFTQTECTAPYCINFLHQIMEKHIENSRMNRIKNDKIRGEPAHIFSGSMLAKAKAAARPEYE